MARTTKEESLRTRQRILDTAIDLFYENGVSATSLENIAEKAGLTRGAIYWHFRNKLDVVTAIHDDLHLSIMEGLYKELHNKEKPPLARMHTASLDFLNSLQHDPLRRRIMTIFLFKCDYSGDMASFIASQQESKQSGQQIFIDCFQEAIERGDIAAHWSPVFLTQAHFALLTGYLYDTLEDPSGAAGDAARLLDFFFHKLAA